MGVALGKPAPEFIDRNVKETQDDPRTDLACFGAALVPFLLRPDSPVHDHIAAERQGTQRDRPLQPLDPASARAVSASVVEMPG